MAGEHVLLVGHGTVEDLDELPQFLAKIRHGRPAPDELAREMRRRYELIGGSPLLSISRELAKKLERVLSRPVHLGMRFSAPWLGDVLAEIEHAQADVVDVVPLAPFSAHVYGDEVRRLLLLQTAHPSLRQIRFRYAANWGSEPLLVAAFASALESTLAELDADRRGSAHVLFTAHSLPLAVVQKGDRYPDEVNAAVQAVVAKTRLANPWRLVYQSQGASGDAWLGPGLREALQDASARGARDVVLCPLGFLSDHIEILYDLDIEARAWARACNVELLRTRSLNADDALVQALASVIAKIPA
jgi:ferrochelatase